MRAWLLALWDSLRSSFWFVPAVLFAGVIALSIGLQAVDQHARIQEQPSFEWFVTTASAARSTLSSLASALIALAGLVFSVTMVTLSLTSSQFGSRLLRTFMNRPAPQWTLGMFLATSLYCLLVLRSIRELNGRIFVPHLSVGAAVLLGVGCLAMLIVFIQHVASAVQAQNVVRTVARDLDDALDRLFPEELGIAVEDDEFSVESTIADFAAPAENIAEVRSTSEGYLQAVDLKTVIEIAQERDLLVRLHCRPGDFVVRDGGLLRCIPASRCTDETCDKLRAAFITGSRRTPRQDLECAIDELVEMAVRALSPGINDPFTAMTCIDHLGASLGRLAARKIPSPFRADDTGRLRVVAEAIAFADALDAAFNQIRQYGSSSVAVSVRMLQALTHVAHQVRRPQDAAAVTRHADMIVRAAERQWKEENDLDDLRRRLEGCRQALEASPAATKKQESVS